MHPSGRDPDVAVAKASIQGQGRLVVDADRKPESIGSSRDHRPLGSDGQGRRDTAPAMLRAHRHVLEFWWIGQGQMGVADWFVILPRNEVVPVALPEASQPEHRTDAFDLVRRQLPDLPHGCSLLLVQDQRGGPQPDDRFERAHTHLRLTRPLSWPMEARDELSWRRQRAGAPVGMKSTAAAERPSISSVHRNSGRRSTLVVAAWLALLLDRGADAGRGPVPH